jgi:hypothetical protein
MAVRLSDLCPSRPLPPGRFLVLISVGGWVDPRAIVWLEGLCQSKKSDDLIGNRTCDLPATLPRSPRHRTYFLIYERRWLLILSDEIDCLIVGLSSKRRFRVLLLATPAQSFLVPSPAGIMTIFHCLTTPGITQLPAQSFFGSGLVGTPEQIFIRSKAIYVFGNVSSLFHKRKGWSFWVDAILLRRNLPRVYPHSQLPVRALVLYGHHTRFVTVLQWVTFMQDIHRTSVNASFCFRLCVNLFYYSGTAVSHLNGRRPDHHQL